MSRMKSVDPRYRKPLAVAAVLQIALTAAALFDIRRRSPDEIKGSKRVWTAASFVNFAGPIAYFVFGRRRG
ncbi:PLD nuclease N-terminal domain-containing protein [Rhodococcus sp. NPDC058514]|uniref:PLD nuclease N-terminal domain-containing protein n=1 Tax=unclassified Rhodococcus (in: high G+C Gram-positive bacteria) TaxID=192944 RepID=UPI00365413D5